MTPSDRQSFIEIVIGFAELKGKQLSAPALELYWNAMQHWTMQDFQQAANHLVRTCEFMPTPRDFESLRKAGRITAGEAWAMVLAAVRRSDYDHGISPLIDRVVGACGGYRLIGQTEVNQTQFIERRFAEHFEVIQDADDTRAAVPQIARTQDALKLSGPQSVAATLQYFQHKELPT
jgi:hypothetical protein